MFEVKATQHVLAVQDLEKVERYFLDTLGFAVRFRLDGWSFLSLGGFHIMLGHCPDEMSACETKEHSYFAYVNCVGLDDLYADYHHKELLIAPPSKGAPLRRPAAGRLNGGRT